MADTNPEYEIVSRAEDKAPVQYDYDHLTYTQRVALDQTVDINRLEKIIQMERDSQQYEAERIFNAALSEMQPELPAVAARGVGDKNAKYGKLEDIQGAIRPALQKHGFAVRFKVHDGDGCLTVECILSHKAGHSDSDRITLPYDTSGSKNAVQARGSTVSYGKRYTLCNILNIQVGGEDDDGNAANPARQTIDRDQMDALDALLTEWGGERKTFFDFYNVKGMADIAVSQFEKAKALLEKKIADKPAPKEDAEGEAQ